MLILGIRLSRFGEVHQASRSGNALPSSPCLLMGNPVWNHCWSSGEKESEFHSMKRYVGHIKLILSTVDFITPAIILPHSYAMFAEWKWPSKTTLGAIRRSRRSGSWGSGSLPVRVACSSSWISTRLRWQTAYTELFQFTVQHWASACSSWCHRSCPAYRRCFQCSIQGSSWTASHHTPLREF